MSSFTIKKGFRIPLAGQPVAVVESAHVVSHVGVVALDYKGLKPRLLVNENTEVKLGSPLFEDKETGVVFTSPGAGHVLAIHRGEKRRLLSVEIALSRTEETVEAFPRMSTGDLQKVPVKTLTEQLNKSGCWATLRERPFGRVPRLEDTPSSIFVSAMDTEPIASFPPFVININAKAFIHGLLVLSRLTEGNVHVCKAEDAEIPYTESTRIRYHTFKGKHPAGLVGTHIHELDPIATITKKVWYIGYQDVIRIGKLFLEGVLFMDRYVALGGPQVLHPRILKTRLGAKLEDLVAGEVREGDNRIISGSPISGRKCEPGTHFLGGYANVVTVLKEDRGRYFQEFMVPGVNKFSLKAVFLSNLFKNKQFSIGTSTHGSHRSVVPIGSYEEVFPLRILATPLVKALLSKDLDAAEQLGALELEGEDLALCTFVCPGKNDISGALEEVLELIYKENQ